MKLPSSTCCASWISSVGSDTVLIKAAAKVVRALRDKAAAYARQPEMGTLHPELGRKLRSFRVGNYIACYEPLDDGLLVLRVFEGHQDYAAWFRSS